MDVICGHGQAGNPFFQGEILREMSGFVVVGGWLVGWLAVWCGVSEESEETEEQVHVGR